MNSIRAALAITVLFVLAACSNTVAGSGAAGQSTPATEAANQKFASDLKLEDDADFAEAKRGFIAAPTGQIRAADGTVLADFDAFKFVQGPAPATVNPSLWRH